MSKTDAESLSSARAGQSTRLASNALLNASGSLAYYAAVVIVTPFAIRGLGEQLWGIWQIIGAVTSYALLINLGLSSAVSYHVAGAVARGDVEELGKSIHTARGYMILAGVAIAATFILLGAPLVEILVDEGDRSIALQALLASTLLTAVTLPARIYPSVISGIQRFDLIAIFRLGASGLLLAVAGFGFYTDRIDLMRFVLLMTVAPIVPAILAWIATRRLLPRASMRWRKTNWSYLREMLSFSINTVLYSVGGVILYQSMKVLASWKAGGPVAAGHMGLAVSIAQILSVLFLPLVSVIHPRTRDLASRGRSDELPLLLRRSLMVVGTIATPVILFMFIETRSIFDAWVGTALEAGSIDSLVRTVRFMLPGQWLFIVFLPCFYAMVGLGEHRIFGLGMVVASLSNAIAGWVLLDYWPRTEALGFVFGITLSALVLCVTLPSTLRRFELGILVALKEAVFVPVVLTAPGLLGARIRPTFEQPIVDLVAAGIVFSLFAFPGVLIARRRLRSIE